MSNDLKEFVSILYFEFYFSFCMLLSFNLKDKSRAGIIVAYSRDYTVVNGM